MVSSDVYQHENLVKLKELSDKLCSFYSKTDKEEKEYKEIIGEIIDLVELSDSTIKEERKKENKLKCYETMCVELKKILTKIKTNLK